MRIAVTGSIATDHLMTFPGRFTDHLIPGHLDRVSLSFLAADLEIHRGGVAANIALGLARLGHSPLLVGAAGADFAEYRHHLEREGVDTGPVLVSTTQHTARFICTTDADHNQIATFYPGAMSEARDIVLEQLADRLGGLDLVVVSPNDPEAMLRHTQECRGNGYPFAADPSQQLARMDGGAIRRLVDGATYLFTNDYERMLLCRKTGWSPEEVRARVGCWVTTYGRDGVRIEQSARPPVKVAATPAACEVDPTGVGDGFRAGFLAGVASRVPLERAAQLGCALATLILQATGPQAYTVRPEPLLASIRAVYGPTAAADIAPHLPDLAHRATAAAEAGGSRDR